MSDKELEKMVDANNVEGIAQLIASGVGLAYYALIRAASLGQAECVELLIPVSDPECYDQALNNAAIQGHAECVNLLIPVSNPQHHYINALYQACFYQHQDCIDLLIPVSDCDSVFETLRDHARHMEAVDLLQERMAHYENTLITSQLSAEPSNPLRLNRKI